MRRVTANDFDFSDAPLFRKTAAIPVANVTFATGGEKVVTLQSSAGGQFVESTNVAQPGDAIVTRSAGDCYIPKKFSNNFEIDPTNFNEYRSKNFGRALFQDEDFIIAAPWGEDQTIMAGGVVFQSLAGNTPEVYGNQAGSFEGDYAREATDGTLLPLSSSLETQLRWAIDKGEIAHLSDIRARAIYAGDADEIIRAADAALDKFSRTSR